MRAFTAPPSPYYEYTGPIIPPSIPYLFNVAATTPGPPYRNMEYGTETDHQLVDIEVEGRVYTMRAALLKKDSRRFRELLTTGPKLEQPHISSFPSSLTDSPLHAIEMIIGTFTLETKDTSTSNLYHCIRCAMHGSGSSPPVAPRSTVYTTIAKSLVQRASRQPELIEALFDMFGALIDRNYSLEEAFLAYQVSQVNHEVMHCVWEVFSQGCIASQKDPMRIAGVDAMGDATVLLATCQMVTALFQAQVRAGFHDIQIEFACTVINRLVGCIVECLDSHDRYPEYTYRSWDSTAEPYIKALYIVLSSTGRYLDKPSNCYPVVDGWFNNLQRIATRMYGSSKVMVTGLLDMRANGWQPLASGQTSVATSPQSANFAPCPRGSCICYFAHSPGGSCICSPVSPTTRRSLKLDDVTLQQMDALFRLYSSHDCYLRQRDRFGNSPAIDPMSSHWQITDLAIILTKYEFVGATSFVAPTILEMSFDQFPAIDRIALVASILGAENLSSNEYRMQCVANMDMDELKWRKILKLAYDHLVEADQPIWVEDAVRIGAAPAAVIFRRREERLKRGSGEGSAPPVPPRPDTTWSPVQQRRSSWRVRDTAIPRLSPTPIPPVDFNPNPSATTTSNWPRIRDSPLPRPPRLPTPIQPGANLSYRLSNGPILAASDHSRWGPLLRPTSAAPGPTWYRPPPRIPAQSWYHPPPHSSLFVPPPEMSTPSGSNPGSIIIHRCSTTSPTASDSTARSATPSIPVETTAAMPVYCYENSARSSSPPSILESPASLSPRPSPLPSLSPADRSLMEQASVRMQTLAASTVQTYFDELRTRELTAEMIQFQDLRATISAPAGPFGRNAEEEERSAERVNNSTSPSSAVQAVHEMRHHNHILDTALPIPASWNHTDKVPFPRSCVLSFNPTTGSLSDTDATHAGPSSDDGSSSLPASVDSDFPECGNVWTASLVSIPDTINYEPRNLGLREVSSDVGSPASSAPTVGIASCSPLDFTLGMPSASPEQPRVGTGSVETESVITLLASPPQVIVDKSAASAPQDSTAQLTNEHGPVADNDRISALEGQYTTMQAQLTSMQFFLGQILATVQQGNQPTQTAPATPAVPTPIETDVPEPEINVTPGPRTMTPQPTVSVMATPPSPETRSTSPLSDLPSVAAVPSRVPMAPHPWLLSRPTQTPPVRSDSARYPPVIPIIESPSPSSSPINFCGNHLLAARRPIDPLRGTTLPTIPVVNQHEAPQTIPMYPRSPSPATSVSSINDMVPIPKPRHPPLRGVGRLVGVGRLGQTKSANRSQALNGIGSVGGDGMNSGYASRNPLPTIPVVPTYAASMHPAAAPSQGLFQTSYSTSYPPGFVPLAPDSRPWSIYPPSQVNPAPAVPKESDLSKPFVPPLYMGAGPSKPFVPPSFAGQTGPSNPWPEQPGGNPPVGSQSLYGPGWYTYGLQQPTMGWF